MKSLMNIEFTPIKQIRINGSLYILERAEVTHYGAFWREWRHAKQVEAEANTLNVKTPKNTLTSKVALSKEDHSYYAHRLVPKDPDLPHGTFKLSYILRDTTKLLPYQVESVAYLCNSIVCNGGALDGSDTGIGKTYQAIGTARELQLIPAIICRKSGICNWITACRHFGIRPLFIVNWEIAKGFKFPFVDRLTDRLTNKPIYRWKLPQNTLLIFDEAHMASTPTSQNHALWIASAGRASLSLSATIADRPQRLIGLFKVLNIMDENRFKQWLSERSTFENKYGDLESLSAVQDMKQVNKILYPRYGFRRSYNDPEVKKFFPEAIVQTEMVNIGSKSERHQLKLYELMLNKVEEFKQKGNQAGVLTAEIRYRQAAELLKCQSLFELAVSYMFEGRAVCIFVNFLDTLHYLAAKFRTKSLIYGQQEKDGIKRDQVIADFQNGVSNIVISMVAAGGQSINLHDVQGKRPRISLVCPNYNPIDIKQVLGRTHRAGSKSRPIIKLVYAANTIEEKVAQSVNTKLDNIAALNEGDLMEPDLFKIGVKR